ncbi:MAG: hypothetical protein JO297_17220, partial [Nitrososphaeraceae archaeon]|nr:hypothetical protein [Nitrososphaeraceae archaeon]
VMTPQNSKIKGKFFVGAEIDSATARRLPVPLTTKRDNNVVNIEYDLSE